MRRYGLRVQKDHIQWHGKCMGYGARPQIIPAEQAARQGSARSDASHLAFGTALCDMICGRPAVGRPFFGEAKLSTSQMRSELHQIVAGMRVGKRTVHMGPSHQ